MSKRCRSCGELKAESEFSWGNKAKGKRQANCRECRRVYDREYYQLHREGQREAFKKRFARYLAEVHEFIANYLQAHPCVDCGTTNPVVLDFDHIDGEKNFSVSYMYSSGYSLERIKAEIEKCDVRCVNCHRMRHAKERGFWLLDYMD